MKLLIDTCCILWAVVAAPDRLSPQAKELLEPGSGDYYFSYQLC